MRRLLHGEAGTQWHILTRKRCNMTRPIASVWTFSLIALGMIGCSDSSTTKKETTISTPGGKTTITIEEKVKTSGDHPPAKAP